MRQPSQIKAIHRAVHDPLVLESVGRQRRPVRRAAERDRLTNGQGEGRGLLLQDGGDVPGRRPGAHAPNVAAADNRPPPPRAIVAVEKPQQG